MSFRDFLLESAGVSYGENEWLDGERYDALDDLAVDLFLHDPIPEETQALTAEMVPYQRTPTRVVLALAAHLPNEPDAVFYDLGAGVGEVAILIHLLTGITARGIEIEPALCAYGRKLIAELNLPRVELINADARDVDFADGTAFFLYTPFTGDVLTTVLERLREVARRRTITVATLGPCTPRVAEEAWLRPATEMPRDAKHLAIFRS